jgi:hypothetical protein
MTGNWKLLFVNDSELEDMDTIGRRFLSSYRNGANASTYSEGDYVGKL